MVEQINEYLKYISFEQLQKVVEQAIDETNQSISTITDRDVLESLGMGRLLETKLARSMNTIPDFTFVHGKENRKDKDIMCVSGLVAEYPANFFSVEVKTSKTKSVIGNKSYANDTPTEGSKDRNSFYIIICNYKEVGIIKSYDAFFGYIEQKDWKPADSGSSAHLDFKKLFYDGKLIKLI